MKAYSDCRGAPIGYETRELHFRAREAVSFPTAVAILRMAISAGYNDFSVDRLEKLLGGLNLRVVIAREFSVCLYLFSSISTLVRVQKLIKNEAQEIDFQPDGSLRLWWD